MLCWKWKTRSIYSLAPGTPSHSHPQKQQIYKNRETLQNILNVIKIPLCNFRSRIAPREIGFAANRVELYTLCLSLIREEWKAGAKLSEGGANVDERLRTLSPKNKSPQNIYITFTFRAISRRFHPKRLKMSTFVIRKWNNNESL